MLFLQIIAATFIVSLISLVGVFALAFKGDFLQKAILGLIGFSAGALIGGAFLHILPEALEKTPSLQVFYLVIFGIVLFFFMERYLHWRHCHEDGTCEVHAFTYLNLIGDAFHNFVDGMLIAASFLVSARLGMVTTLAVMLHEIPQELGDFGVLIYGGFSRQKALFYNFLSALTAVLGAILVYFIADVVTGISSIILPITAGGFIYIATSDLIPEMHKEKNRWRSALSLSAFLLGIAFMALARKFLHV